MKRKEKIRIDGRQATIIEKLKLGASRALIERYAVR